MNKALAIGKLALLEALRDRSIWVSLIVVPLLLTLVMGIAFGGGGSQQKKVPLLLVDQDKTTFSRLFINALKTDKVWQITVVDEAAARDQVRRGLVSGAIIIPTGYADGLAAGSAVKIKVLNTVGDSNSALLSQITSGLTNRYSTDAFAAAKTVAGLTAAGRLSPLQTQAAWEEAFEQADKAWSPPPVTVDAKALSASAVRGEKTLASGFNMSSMGFTVTFIMFMLVGGASSILEERQQGTLGRLLTTPTSKTTYLTGKILGLFAVAAVQATILVGAGRLIFNVDWGRNPLPLIAIMIAFIFAIASLGILVAALSRTAAQAQSMTPVLLISMAMLGGCYWPIEITPPFMQAIAKFIPAGWMMKGLVDLITRGYGWTSIVTPSLVLLGFGVVFLVAGVFFLKFE
jgi:ABC-2 type transport system permease protein